jgi:hypothetical protein
MFKTGYKQVILNSRPEGFSIDDATADDGLFEKMVVPGFATFEGTDIPMVKIEGLPAQVGRYNIDIASSVSTANDIIDITIHLSAEAVRFFPDIFSYSELKLVSAKAGSTASATIDNLIAVFDKNKDDEFFSQNIFSLSKSGNNLVVTIKAGYEGLAVVRAEESVTKFVTGLPTGAVVKGNLPISVSLTASVGVLTGKELEAEVRNAQFENIDPYGIHFGGNDQHVDVRGVYNGYVIETSDDHENGWAPHEGLGYGDANTETKYADRKYIIYALKGSTIDTILDGVVI